MLSSLNGILEGFDEHCVYINVQGLGITVHVSPETLGKLPQPGTPIRLETHFLLRQEQPTLYGFFTREERHFFEVLITIQGVGPKVALGLLGSFTPKDLIWILESQDDKALTRVDGVGPKLARRIANEAKDKISKFSIILHKVNEHPTPTPASPRITTDTSGASDAHDDPQGPGNQNGTQTLKNHLRPSPLERDTTSPGSARTSVATDAVLALEALGFERAEAVLAVQKIIRNPAAGEGDSSHLTEQQIIKQALRQLSPKGGAGLGTKP